MSYTAEFRELMTSLTSKLGDDAVYRLHPFDPALPAQAVQKVSARFTEPVFEWALSAKDLPVVTFNPKEIELRCEGNVPINVIWKGALYQISKMTKLNLVEPDWWLSDPFWQTGARQYWRFDTIGSHAFYIYHAQGADLPAGWFCEGWF